MPWTVNSMDDRSRFVHAHERRLYTMTELCQRFDISRQTGYKWLSRYREGGVAALADRSRAPRHSPQRISAARRAQLLELREAHPTWGPRKILGWLRYHHLEGEDPLPAASTVGDLFRREGLVAPRRRRRRPSRTPAGPLRAEAPNAVWTADFKGEFRMGNGRYCYPFTLADAYSRFLLACSAQPATSLTGVKATLIAAFRAYGLPRALRTDNGIPFASHGATGLTRLSVWLIQLGLVHQRIAPGRPDQNGRHERMHRTLKAEATRPPEASLRSQQRRFDAFRQSFNQVRPHEALGQQPPVEHYEASPRPYPETLAPPVYPGHFEPRRVDATGHFRFRGLNTFLAHPLAGHQIALTEVEPDIWSIRFYHYELGRINPKQRDVVIKVSAMSPV